MGIAINKRSVMTLFSEVNSLYSHLVRFVLAEKEVLAEIEFVDPNDLPQEFIDNNPYGSIPVLIDRDLSLYEPHIIIEYLDERFPHPPLMPVYPVVRANSRSITHRINKEWYSVVEALSRSPDDKKAQQMRNNLVDEVTAIAPILKETLYFMSNEFNLIDCYMAPLLWRLSSVGVALPKSAEKILSCYMERLFQRETFINSLTDEELKLKN